MWSAVLLRCNLAGSRGVFGGKMRLLKICHSRDRNILGGKLGVRLVIML